MDHKEQTGRQTEMERALADLKIKMEQISARLTEQDCQALEEEGFYAEDLTVNGLYAALNRVKASDTSGNPKEQKNPFTEEGIKERLRIENLPATKDNIRNVKTALELSEITSKINDKTIKYMVSNALEPTVENIYKAYYNGNTLRSGKALTLSAQDWSELKSQAGEIIKSAGYEVNNENLADARWLIENGLALTAKSYDSKKELENIKDGTDKKKVLDKIIEGMKEGTLPKDVSLHPDKDYEKLIEDMKGITEEAVSFAVKDGSDLTLRSLIEIQGELSTERQRGTVVKAGPGSAAKADSTVAMMNAVSVWPLGNE
jgi:hypothetical protein